MDRRKLKSAVRKALEIHFPISEIREGGWGRHRVRCRSVGSRIDQESNGDVRIGTYQLGILPFHMLGMSRGPEHLRQRAVLDEYARCLERNGFTVERRYPAITSDVEPCLVVGQEK